MVPSVDKHGRRQPSLIKLFIAFSSDLLELYCQEIVYTILFMNTKISNCHIREFISIFICLLQVLAFQRVRLLYYNVFLHLLVLKALLLPSVGSGTIRTKTSSSWDDSPGTVRIKFRTGLFAQHYLDGSPKI